VLTRHARWLFRIAFIAAFVGIWILAVMPAPPPVGSSYDKLNHVFAFFVLGVLARLAWPEGGAFKALTLLLLFGILIEVVQYFVGRDASAFDVLADSIGLLLAISATHIAQPGVVYSARDEEL